MLSYMLSPATHSSLIDTTVGGVVNRHILVCMYLLKVGNVSPGLHYRLGSCSYIVGVTVGYLNGT